jgi:hypothetical protein
MRVRRPAAVARDRLRPAAGWAAPAVARDRLRPAAGWAAPAVLALVVAACSGSGAPAATRSSAPAKGGQVAAAHPVTCGTTRTAANVPVHIQIKRGHVSCATALTVERDYASAILHGKAPGNGGGGPVNVKGWTCEGFSTPQVLRTGQASKCVEGNTEILAILPAPA